MVMQAILKFCGARTARDSLINRMSSRGYDVVADGVGLPRSRSLL